MKKLLAVLVAMGFLATSIGFAEAAKKKCDPKCKKAYFTCVKEKAGAKDFKALKALPKDKKKAAFKECKPVWRDCCGFKKKAK